MRQGDRTRLGPEPPCCRPLSTVPLDPDILIALAVLERKITLIGTSQGLTDPAGQMDAGRGDHGLALLIGHGHEPFQGAFVLFLLFNIVDEIGDLQAVLLVEFALDFDGAGRILVGDPFAGRTQGNMGVRFGGIPGPAAIDEQGLAPGTHARLRQFLPLLICIMPLFLDEPVFTSKSAFIHFRPPIT